nr:hypothetical protein [Nocardia terpenica]
MLEDQLGGVTLLAVLLLRLLDPLPGERVLQLGRRHGNAVEQQRQIEPRTRGRLRRERQLPHDRKPVRPVGVQHILGADEIRFEVGDPDQDTPILHALLENLDQSLARQFLAEPLREPALCGILIVTVGGNQVVPLRMLGLLNEGQQFPHIQPELGPILVRIPLPPAILHHRRNDGLPERLLTVH